MKPIAIVQARMGSSRFPGKVLKEIDGKPMLHHVVNRLRASRSLHGVVVATTNLPEDRQVVDAAERLCVPVFTGSEHDVLDRYFQAAKFFGADPAIRVTADCPLVDPVQVDRLVGHLDPQRFDYVATGATFPEGYGAEVFTFGALSAAWENAHVLSDREHVTPYIWGNPSRFKVARVELAEDWSRFRMTVDWPVDLQVVSELVRELSPGDPVFGVERAVRYIKTHPHLSLQNSHIERLQGYRKSLSEDHSQVDRVPFPDRMR